MGLVYKSAAQRAAAAASNTTTTAEPPKAPACPYTTWSYDAAFDPDSEEFFADAVYEAVVCPIQPPAPLSPIESASASSSDSGRISPDATDSIDDESMPELDEPQPGETLRRVQQDVESLTWLARVPTDAHDVPAAPRPAPATVNIQRARSISDAPNPQSYQRYVAHARQSWLSSIAGRGYALVPPPTTTRDEPPAPAEPERRAGWSSWDYADDPITPSRQYEYTTQTPVQRVLTPPSLTYGPTRHGRLPSLVDGPTVTRIATTF
ncbi:hypothetical protein PENSPDRAFT_690122 [Peniophora sp. CONT]|nr:hypothetical protein PENSPDRAFT_690122 [Peniophora sp. CONT]